MAMVRLALASATMAMLAGAPGVLRPELLPTLLIDSPRLGVVGILVIFLYIEFAKIKYDLYAKSMRCTTTDSPV